LKVPEDEKRSELIKDISKEKLVTSESPTKQAGNYFLSLHDFIDPNYITESADQ